MQAARFARKCGAGALDGGLKRLGAGRHRHIVEPFGKIRPFLVLDLAGRELRERIAGQRAEFLGIDIVERYANDAAAGNEARRAQVIEAGQ